MGSGVDITVPERNLRPDFRRVMCHEGKWNIRDEDIQQLQYTTFSRNVVDSLDLGGGLGIPIHQSVNVFGDFSFSMTTSKYQSVYGKDNFIAVQNSTF